MGWGLRGLGIAELGLSRVEVAGVWSCGTRDQWDGVAEVRSYETRAQWMEVVGLRSCGTRAQ